MEEMIDIYDENRQRTGERIPREGAFLKEGQYMLYVLAIIENQEGKILITQRSQDKHWAPGWWEVTGGGVRAGEWPEETVVREVAEEVGLDVSNMNEKPVYAYVNVDLERGDNYIVDIYRYRLAFEENDVTLQQSEAVAFQLATWEQITALKEQGLFLHFDRIRQALEAEGAAGLAK